MDFTITSYRRLLNAFMAAGYVVMPYSDYCRGSRADRFVILRHDVDRLPGNALRIALLEHEFGLRSSFYFRSRYFSRRHIIEEIASLNHEVGYHYEDLAAAKGDSVRAFERFKSNLDALRTIVPVSTVVMHGSPLSSVDNLDLWCSNDYRSLGILGEPFIDVDFNELFYITDTGRSWNGISRRDSVRGAVHPDWPVYHSTADVISALEDGSFPHRLMLTSHPQRWIDNMFCWTYELVSQSVKNLVKQFVIRLNPDNK